MKPTLLNIIDNQVLDFRKKAGLGSSDAVSLKRLLLRLNVLTVFRPLSNTFYGMSLRSGEKRFMLINSNNPVCRQNFTIAHELYHLFVEDNSVPHNCGTPGKRTDSERCADAFALRLLMPADGIRQMIPLEELLAGEVSMATLLRIEHYFSTSHTATLNRLYDLKLISSQLQKSYSQRPIKQTAREYGYNPALYEAGNHNLIIGDFGEKARKLFEEGKISEGHYFELLHKIGINDSKD